MTFSWGKKPNHPETDTWNGNLGLNDYSKAKLQAAGIRVLKGKHWAFATSSISNAPVLIHRQTSLFHRSVRRGKHDTIRSLHCGTKLPVKFWLWQKTSSHTDRPVTLVFGQFSLHCWRSKMHYSVKSADSWDNCEALEWAIWAYVNSESLSFVLFAKFIFIVIFLCPLTSQKIQFSFGMVVLFSLGSASPCYTEAHPSQRFCCCLKPVQNAFKGGETG